MIRSGFLPSASTIQKHGLGRVGRFGGSGSILATAALFAAKWRMSKNKEKLQTVEVSEQ